MARRSYRGNSVATTVAIGITAVDTTLSVADGSGLPVGTNPFVITVNANKAGEEKILVGGRSGNTLSGLTRGYDGTTAGSHLAGESVTHTISATDLDEANAHVNDTTRDDHTQYAFVKKTTAALRGAAGRSMRLHYGTDSGLLAVDDGSAWHEFAPAVSLTCARAYQASAQTLPATTLTAVTLDGESYDSATLHDTVTNNSRVTVPTTGKYAIKGSVTFLAGAGTQRQVRLRKNGAGNLAYISQSVAAAVPITVLASTDVQLSAGDYVELVAYHDHTSSLVLSNVESETFLSVSFLGS